MYEKGGREHGRESWDELCYNVWKGTIIEDLCTWHTQGTKVKDKVLVLKCQEFPWDRQTSDQIRLIRFNKRCGNVLRAKQEELKLGREICWIHKLVFLHLRDLGQKKKKKLCSS